MPQQRYYLAIDIGASSGRHVLGSVNSNGVIELEEVHRFDNVQVRRRGHDCWDIDMIWENILVGLEKCRKAGKIPETIGIDTWGVDFVLVDAQGRLVGDAVAYRDARTTMLPPTSMRASAWRGSIASRVSSVKRSTRSISLQRSRASIPRSLRRPIASLWCPNT